MQRMRPKRVRTCAPIGQTPVLQYRFPWTNMALIAGISFWRFCLRLFTGAIRSPQFVEFLKALNLPEARAAMIRNGATPHPESPAEFAAVMKAECARIAPLGRQANISLDSQPVGLGPIDDWRERMGSRSWVPRSRQAAIDWTRRKD